MESAPRSLAGYYISEPAVEKALERHFMVQDRYFYMDQPNYAVTPLNTDRPKRSVKRHFEALVKDIRPYGYIPRLSRDLDTYRISLNRVRPSKPSNHRRNIYLFLATTATIYLDGYLRSNNPILVQVLMPDTPVYINALLFTLGILAVFGLHELGHKVVTSLRGVEASMPYFIPAPPGMGGTFGAIITQKEPPTNRDALFDLGLSGPLVGFLITVLVAVVGLRLSFVVPLEEVNVWMVSFPEIRFQSIPFPLLLEWLSNFLRPVPDDMVLILHPVGFAAWVGSLVTFINLIPAWQLDGGHVSRALLGKSYHKIMSVVGIIILLLSGYFIMAVMVAFFMMRSNGVGDAPLDDISPLSLSRKILVIVYLVMVLLTLVSLFPL
ncbi:MAG: site-2 protease family protein [Candidatus Bathyarchaeota archaeon]|jgi:Zn-dependent protease